MMTTNDQDSPMPDETSQPDTESPQEDMGEGQPQGTLTSYLEQVNIAEKLEEQQLVRRA